MKRNLILLFAVIAVIVYALSCAHTPNSEFSESDFNANIAKKWFNEGNIRVEFFKKNTKRLLNATLKL